MPNPLQAMELRNQLRYAKAQIEGKNEMLALQRSAIERQERGLERQEARIDQLLDLVGQGVGKEVSAQVNPTISPVIEVAANPSATAHTEQAFNFTTHLPVLQAHLSDLTQALPEKERPKELAKPLPTCKR